MSRPCDEDDLSADTPEWAWPEGAVGQPDVLPYRLEEQVKTSVPDPDLQVFGPPGSVSVSQRYRSISGSRSFHYQGKIVTKTFISIVLWLLDDFLSLKNDVKVPLKSNNKKLEEKYILLTSWRSLTKRAGCGAGCGYGSVPKCHRSGALVKREEKKTEKLVNKALNLSLYSWFFDYFWITDAMSC